MAEQQMKDRERGMTSLRMSYDRIGIGMGDGERGQAHFRLPSF